MVSNPPPTAIQSRYDEGEEDLRVQGPPKVVRFGTIDACLSSSSSNSAEDNARPLHKATLLQEVR